MKNIFLSIIILISSIFMLNVPLVSQSGTPLLKIVVDEHGNKHVYDMQGNEVGANGHNSQQHSYDVQLSPKKSENNVTIQSELARLSEFSVNENFNHPNSMVIQSENQPVMSIPSSNRYNNTIQAINSGKSTSLQQENILNSNLPEAKLHVETKQLHKTNLNPGPNLWAIAAHTSYYYHGTTLDVNVRVINNGTSASTSNSTLGYFLSFDPTITYHDFYIGFDIIPILNAGETSDESISVDLTTVPGLPSGPLWVGFILDLNNVIIEDNEGDNNWHFSPAINSPGGTTAPNLTKNPGYSHNFNYSAPYLTINTSVKNVGDGTAVASELGYYLSLNTMVTTDDILIGTDPVYTLYASGYSDESITVDLIELGVMGPSTYYVGYIIDHLNQVNESNEFDNIWHWNSPTIDYQNLPDLEPVWAHTNYSYTDPYLTINIRVINNGLVTADHSILGYYLSENIAISTMDYRVETDYVTSLASEAYSIETISLNLQIISSSPTLPDGTHTYYVGFIIDYGNAVAESDEDNNRGVILPSITFNRGGTAESNLTAQTEQCSFDFSSAPYFTN